MTDYTDNPYEYLMKGLGKRIYSEMHRLGLDQKELALQSRQSQATISNIISGKTSVSMKTVFEVMQVLNLDPLVELEYCSRRTEQSEVSLQNPITNLLTSNSQQLIYDPNHIAFHGQLGHYYTYFHSTNPNSSRLIRGDLTMYEEQQLCRVKMQINAGDTSSPADKEIKIYTGYAFISLIQKAVYVLLTNEFIGEMSFLIFPYQQILTKGRRIECTMAMALTVSSGVDSRLPTAHRIFLSRKLLDSDSEKLIMAQLLMNKSMIRISESQYREMLLKEHMNRDFINYFQHHMSKTTYYEIDEDIFKQFIRKIPETYQDICMLREYSTAPKNMKISENAISRIFHRIIKTQYDPK